MTSGDSASSPGAKRSSAPSAALGRWLLPPDHERERVIRADNWVEATFEPAALVVLVVLFVAGVVSFGLALAPSWDARPLTPICLVVAVEAVLYTRRLGRANVRSKEWGALLMPPLLALRFLPYALGPGSLANDLGWWWREPQSFFTGSFLANSLLLAIAWLLALGGAKVLSEIRLQAGEIAQEQARRHFRFDDDNWMPIDHAEPLRRLANWVVWGGVLLVLLAGLATLNVRQGFDLSALLQLVTFSRPAVSLALTNVILYFAIGLCLLAEGQYVLQRTRWRLEHLVAPTSLPGRWVAQAAIVLGLVVALALLLPTDYALTVSRMLEIAVGGAMSVVQLALGLLVLVIAVVTWPFRMLMPQTSEQATALPPPQPIVVDSAPPPAAVPWLDVLQSLVFWAIALVIVAYCLAIVARRMPPLEVGRGIRLLAAIRSLFSSLLAAFRRLGRRAATVVALVLPRLRPSPAPSPAKRLRWVPLSRLTPDRLVEYYYLSTLERAARAGVPRRVGETPAEYVQRVPSQVPEVGPDLNALTQAFEGVRYGGRTADSGLVAAAKARWQRLKLALRGRRLGQLARQAPQESDRTDRPPRSPNPRGEGGQGG